MNLPLMRAIVVAMALCLPAFAEPSAEDILRECDFQGGLIVHLGCGDGQATAELCASEPHLVHGLDTDAANVAKALAHFHSQGISGKASASEFDGTLLPYSDSLVNLLVADKLGRVSMDEVMRVLAPNGVAYVKSPSGWKKTVKPWPAELDQWTHFHHDPQGTMVGHDKVVGPPRRIQWQAGPKWLRNHDFMSSMHAMVSAEGRIFYVIDEGLRNHIFLPSRWMLIARDGFNGTVLWKQPLIDWHPNNWPLKSGPGHYPRRLVAVGDRVYVAAGLTDPVRSYDAATGQLVRTYEETKPTQEIILANGTLYLLVDPKIPPVDFRAEATNYKEIGRANSGWAWSPESPPRAITAIEADSGRLLWQHVAPVAPLTLTVADKTVYYHNGAGVVAIDRATGQEIWATDGPAVKSVPTGSTLRVVYADGVVLFASGTKLMAFSADGGEQLWDGSLMKTSHHCPEDLFVIGDDIWSINTGKPQENGTHFKVLNLKSGEITQDFVAENIKGFPMHPRCYPSRATTEYIMTNGMGTEFYRVGGTTVDVNNAVRGSCIYGVMPSNGFLYKPPDSCACYYQSKLEYLCALAPNAAGEERTVAEAQRLVRGPAYQKVQGSRTAVDDWPMYRQNAVRGGATASAVSAKLKEAWSVELGGKLTQPVTAGGKVFVAAKNEHTLTALDAGSGEIAWQFIAGGRIDSSPTCHNGTVLFGSADGWVYCLDARSGTLAWRYLVAPGAKNIVSYEQVESAWPVSGSVLVVGDSVYCMAGRNMFFDGGIRLVQLDASTGKLVTENMLDENDPRTGKNLQTLISAKYMPVANADLLSSDGSGLYMQGQKFDFDGKRMGIAPGERPEFNTRHLFCQTGFLDDLWFHRSYLIYGEDCREGWGNYMDPRRVTPCGRLLVVDDSRAYGYRADPLHNMLHPRSEYTLYAADKDPTEQPAAAPGSKRNRRGSQPTTEDGKLQIGGCKVHWQTTELPLLANAMTVAGESLILAGPPDLADETAMFGFLPGADDDANRQLGEQEKAWLGEHGGLLVVVSAASGEKLAEYEMESYPIFDGMSAGGGSLYLSQIDGTVVKYAVDD